MQKFSQRLIYFFSFLTISFMSFQILLYRQYAFEATWLYAREAMSISTVTDQRKHGAICNSIGRYNCSVRIFRELQKESPSDTEILSNLAMALTFTDKVEEAFPYFKAYFSSGGKAFDVMYWYAKALKISGQNQEALTWFYNVLYYKPDDIVTARELVATLALLNRPLEALGFMAALMDQNRDDASNELWLTELQKLENPKRQVANAETETTSINGTNKSDEYKLPALDGRRFFIPIQTKRGEYQFIVADERESDFVLSESDLKSIGWSHQRVSAQKAIIDQIQIGELRANRVEVQLCQSCISKIGHKFLTTIDAHIDGRAKIPYLVIQRETYE